MPTLAAETTADVKTGRPGSVFQHYLSSGCFCFSDLDIWLERFPSDERALCRCPAPETQDKFKPKFKTQLMRPWRCGTCETFWKHSGVFRELNLAQKVIKLVFGRLFVTMLLDYKYSIIISINASLLKKYIPVQLYWTSGRLNFDESNTLSKSTEVSPQAAVFGLPVPHTVLSAVIGSPHIYVPNSYTPVCFCTGNRPDPPPLHTGLMVISQNKEN